MTISPTYWSERAVLCEMHATQYQEHAAVLTRMRDSLGFSPEDKVKRDALWRGATRLNECAAEWSDLADNARQFDAMHKTKEAP